MGMRPEPGGYGYSDRRTLMLHLMLPETSFKPDKFEHVYEIPDIAIPPLVFKSFLAESSSTMGFLGYSVLIPKLLRTLSESWPPAVADK